MGGQALNLQRIEDKEFYFEIFEELNQKISKYFYRFELIPSYRNKNSFGDMDILCINYDNFFDINDIINECGSKLYVKNGNVLSVEYKDFQVDLIFTKEKFFQTSLLYYSYNDLGNLMGRIAHNMHIDIKYGHFGLKKIFYSLDKDRIFLEHILSTDAKKIFDFLGFSYEKYEEGFDDIEDIFKFVVESDFFSKSIFQYENLNNENRTRNKKRKSYNMFLDYIEKNCNNTTTWFQTDTNRSIKKIWHENRLIKFFPEVQKLEKIVNERLLDEKTLNEKFNGNIFMENTGLSGKELGIAINKFKKKYSNKFLIQKSPIEIIQLIKNEQKI